MRDSEIHKQKRLFAKMITDKKICKVEKNGLKYFLYYNDGSIFKCAGFLPEDYGLEEFGRKEVVKKKLF